MYTKLQYCVFIAIAAMILLGTGTGCQTGKGLGQDVENLGEKIQRKAN